MRNWTLYIGCLVALLGLGAFSSEVVLSQFKARTEATSIVVQWQATVETDVQDYMLERKTLYDPAYKDVRPTPFPAQGANQLYEYKDASVYKVQAEQVEYRLRIRFKDGTMTYYDRTAVAEYTSTAVRRTWGSIKAMFQ